MEVPDSDGAEFEDLVSVSQVSGSDEDSDSVDDFVADAGIISEVIVDAFIWSGFD